jgi:hypothetical protein
MDLPLFDRLRHTAEQRVELAERWEWGGAAATRVPERPALDCGWNPLQ